MMKCQISGRFCHDQLFLIITKDFNFNILSIYLFIKAIHNNTRGYIPSTLTCEVKEIIVKQNCSDKKPVSERKSNKANKVEVLISKI